MFNGSKEVYFSKLPLRSRSRTQRRARQRLVKGDGIIVVGDAG